MIVSLWIGNGTTDALGLYMHLNRSLLTLLLLPSCVLIGCDGAPAASERKGSSESSVIGTPSTAAPSVGYIARAEVPSEPVYCTGTLIAPDVVLTAAHCFQPIEGSPRGLTQVGEAAITSGEQVTFGVGSIGGATVRGKTLGIHRQFGSGAAKHDLAYLVLEAPITGVKIATVRRAAHLGNCGYVALGYGFDADGIAGNRNSASMCADSGTNARGFIEAYDDEERTCNGDSGSPLRLSGESTLVGVLSEGTRADCGIGDRSLYVPLATELAFVDEALAASAP